MQAREPMLIAIDDQVHLRLDRRQHGGRPGQSQRPQSQEPRAPRRERQLPRELNLHRLALSIEQLGLELQPAALIVLTEALDT